MNEREKVQKAFNQCSDALISLDAKSILKVFQLLSVQFDIITFQPNSEKGESNNPTQPQVYLPPANEYVEEERSNQDKLDKKAKNGNPKKGKSATSKEPQYLTNFDFRPNGKESLKEFFGKYDTKSNLEYNLIFIYYLQEVVGETNINVDMVYSCYRHLNLKVPVFPQTLRDTRSRKGWIDTADSDNLKITREGRNFMEHEISKKNG